MSDSNKKDSVFPTGNADLDKLHEMGDPLERLICEDFESLQEVLFQYAQVWARHIEPHRKGDGAFLETRWQKFGGRHYTALVRLHHALAAKNRIAELCGAEIRDDDYGLLLEVHYSCAAFYDNLGAAIDNFVRARDEAKKALSIEVEKRPNKEKCVKCGTELAEEKIAARTLSSTGDPKLFYAFERRHQFIHSIIVPQRIENGEIRFNAKHFDEVATDWSEEIIVDLGINRKIQADWEEIMKEFGDRWARLFVWLEEQVKQRQNNKDSSRTEVVLKGSRPSEQVDLFERVFRSATPPPLSGSRTPPPSGTYRG